MNWENYIHSNPDILLGKPIIKSTRLSVEFIIQRFANGWTTEQILENYPQLSKEALQAVFCLYRRLHVLKFFGTNFLFFSS